ncbi:MAG: YlbL family protein [Pseudonocardia sp.]
MVSLLVVGITTPAPVVALGRGPTFDTLGQVDGQPVVAITALPTYPTSGQLNMTTVGVTDGLTMVEVLRQWASGDFKIIPRSSVFPPGASAEEVASQNREQFVDSQFSAETAALDHVGLATEVFVDGLSESSPSAGVLAVGDRLLSVAGRPVQGLESLHEALADTRPGQPITVGLQRNDGPPQQVLVTLGESPTGPRGMLGVLPGARPPGDAEIIISLGDIGGPSAGLIFALAVVDKLTPGELTGGRFVAGTGTIRFDGVVGRIDGIRFKMLTARESGATVFLVPADNCAEARSAAPEGLQLVKVDNLAGAVAALDALRAGRTPASC